MNGFFLSVMDVFLVFMVACGIVFMVMGAGWLMARLAIFISGIDEE